MGIESVINGGLSFAAVLVLMALNIPIGIAMLVVGFTGFALGLATKKFIPVTTHR